MDNESQQVPPIPNKPEIKTAKNLSFAKTLSYGFVIVSVGVSIAIGGYLLGVSKTKPQPVAKTSVTPVVSPTPDPTANWKTFIDVQRGLSIKYPRDWKFDEQGDKNILLVDFCGPKYWEKTGNCRMAGKGSTAAITLRNDSLDIDRAGFCSQNPMNMFCGKVISRKEITIGGMKGKIFEMEINGGSLVALWKGSVADERMYELSADDLVSFPENRVIFNQILSTFKFTDQNQAESIDSWRTYTNKTYGFEMKYPKEYAYLENSIEPKINIVYFDAPANIKGNPSIILSVDKDPQTLLFQGTFNTVPQPKADNAKLVSSGNININGVSFKKDYWRIRDSIVAINFYTKRGSSYFTASLGISINGADRMNSNELLKAISKDKKSIIFDQMLSTLKFTK